MQVAITETANAELPAGDMIKLRGKDRTDRITINLKSIENCLSNDDVILSEKRKLELLAEKDPPEKRKQSIEDMWQNPNEKVNRRKIQQRKKRLILKLIEDNRIKNRKLGAGAKRLLDLDGEVFIAKAIQEKCTAHGRRTDMTLYVDHRVKKKDFKNLANYNLSLRGKKLSSQ